ncbi:MAG TPA: 30S ribosomal protein S3, partial [Thermoplasmatales archaeon]|nr:30S ribosomal protein S3 [Thermoplasmatales archaeon]
VGHSTVRRIMSSGARGCQIIISGKITGARHRTEKFTKGHVKYCGEVAKEVMNEGMAVAKKKPGILGIKVRIMKPGAKMPDEIEIISGSVEKAEEEVKEKEKVKKETPAKTIKEEKLEKLTLDELPGLGESMIKKLKKAGIKDVKELYEMSVEDMVGIKGIGIKKAEKLKEAIEKAVK